MRRLGHCQTRNKVEQLPRSTLLRDKVARLLRNVAQLLTSRAANLLDGNHLYSLLPRQLCRATKFSEKLLNFVAYLSLALRLCLQTTVLSRILISSMSKRQRLILLLFRRVVGVNTALSDVPLLLCRYQLFLLLFY